ncbi:ankyrin repeat domain-containing protein 39-like isoform X2 [Xenia sp. Carnegie-2017]|uniref:ankyrin repeat domain-containing protein 39-like isoform X2 n=1 Tax=Xenia sp. Carnegie-2017 TaxID=2897299 RepID=UPI001F035B5D|nr:ankyrin repeat domain-containing protein 39-like isoform X2 [Xenia sp. Carnegie-2017]
MVIMSAHSMAHEHEHNHGTCCKSVSRTCSQNFDEMDFARGVWYAAMNGDEARVQKHLEKNSCPDIVDSAGYTALHYAARNGHIDVCRLLLRHGANPNCETRAGRATPLHRAAYGGHLEIVKLLVQYQAKLDLADIDGQTALHKAAQKAHEDVVKILVDAFVLLTSVRDKWHKRPIDYVPEIEVDIAKHG